MPATKRYNQMHQGLVALGLAAIAAPAMASSNAAWKQLETEATRACVKASAFRRPRVSNLVIFEDRVGQVAMLVTGIFPQIHMKGASGTNLCLFDRRTKRAVVEEAKGWRSHP